MPNLFGTSGIRGSATGLFTNQFCFDIGRSFARFLDLHEQPGKIAIGSDSRSSFSRIFKSLASGLIHEDREIEFLGVTPSPAVLYSLISAPYVAGIMITGSHIDITLNGLKFFCLKEEITKNHELEISKIYASLKEKIPYRLLTNKDNLISTDRGFQNYFELLLSLADQPLPKLKIIFDPGNGAQTEIIKMLLLELGQHVIDINSNLQQELISRDTEKDGAFDDLGKAILKHKADLGIGFDTDGDRVAFVDHKGQFIHGDYIGTLLAKWNPTDVVVTPISTSNVIDSIGKQVVRTAVGSPNVIAAIKKYGSLFGFESNGGSIHADIMLTRDGGASLVRMLNILKWSDKTLSQLVDELPKYYLFKQKFDCPTEKNNLILKSAKLFSKTKSIDETDGVKLILDDHTWILFRPSNNAPEFRIFTQSNSKTKAKQLLISALEFAKNV